MNADKAITKSPRSLAVFQRELTQYQQETGAERQGGWRFLLRDAFPRLELTKEVDFKFPLDAEGKVTQQVVGVRGVIVYYGHGLSLYSSGEQRPICSTVGAKYPDELGNEVLYRSPYPSATPIRVVDEGYDGTPTPSTDLKLARTIGSRGKSCVECVLAGEHVVEQNGSKNYCAPLTFLALYATEVCVNDMQPVTKNGMRVYVDNPVWVPIVEWTDARQRRLFESPVIVQLRLSSNASRFITYSDYQRKDGTKRGNYLVVQGYNGPSAEARRAPLAPANCLPWYMFFKQKLMEAKHLFQHVEHFLGSEDYSTFVFGHVVEVYAAEIVQVNNGVDVTSPNGRCIPVFRLADVSKEYHDDAVQQAIACYKGTLQQADAGKASDEALEFYEPEPAPTPPPAASQHPTLEAAQRMLQARMK